MSAATVAKFKWKPRLREALLPPPRTLKQSEVIAYLGRNLFEDCVVAGWLKPCAQRENARDTDTKWYALSAVTAIEDRMLNGDLPPVREKKGGVA